MNPAAKCRTEKAEHPERFCPDKKCLWRVVTSHGLRPCPKHQAVVVEHDLTTSRGMFSEMMARHPEARWAPTSTQRGIDQ